MYGVRNEVSDVGDGAMLVDSLVDILDCVLLTILLIQETTYIYKTLCAKPSIGGDEDSNNSSPYSKRRLDS